MATWELSTAYKKSSVERQIWTNGDKVIIREEGYRWGTFTIESDTMPITHEELVENDEYEVGYVDDDNYWEMVDLIDGCWADTEKGRNCTDEDLEKFEEAWEENYYEGVEELGWSCDDTEYYLTGPLILVNKDTGQEFSGLVDPATVVHKLEFPEEKVEETKTEVKLDPNAPWPWGPELANTVETAKWPFDRPQEGPKEEVEEVEAVEGFTDLTDWHSAEHYYPTNPGRYQVNSYNSENWPFPTFAEWDGKKWSDDKVISWRGLASDPGAK